MHDEALMRRALALAARGAGNTSPNPMVGAVVADGRGKEIASGYHERAGMPHAEAIALERAGVAAAGSTLYVTLEPCNHHGRTGPCTEAILRAGVARVVVATQDADHRARGAGIERLRGAGVKVDVGVCEEMAQYLLRRYLHHRRTGRPFVALKMAQSLNGAIGSGSRERTFLTGKTSASYVRRLRYENDAVMIGADTAIVDDPRLTVRPYKERAVPYSRVVVDSSARLPLESNLVADRRHAATIVAVTDQASTARVEALSRAGVEVLECRRAADGRVDLKDLLDRLGAMGMVGVLCEGGPTLGAALLNAGLVNELHLLIAPIVLNTAQSPPVFAGLAGPASFTVGTVRKLGDDTLIVAAKSDAGASKD